MNAIHNHEYVGFDVQYNRSKKEYVVTTYYASAFHPLNGVMTENSPGSVYRCIGMIIAGQLGPKSIDKQVAILNAMFAYVNCNARAMNAGDRVRLEGAF